jgi:hypothetical protein
MEPPDPQPTIRQIYALAAVLCERAGEDWPETRRSASELIERLRIETGHPAPRLDRALRPRVRRGGSRPNSAGRGTEKLAKAIARQLAAELRTPAEVAAVEESR